MQDATPGNPSGANRAAAHTSQPRRRPPPLQSSTSRKHQGDQGSRRATRAEPGPERRSSSSSSSIDEEEARSFRRALRVPKYALPPVAPDSPDWPATRPGRRFALQQSLRERYGEHFGDTDVRLFLRRRAHNASVRRGTARGGLPLDDSLPQPGTFAKLADTFQKTLLEERCQALCALLPALPHAHAQLLYRAVPGLLTMSSMRAAQHLRGISRATGWSVQTQLVLRLLEHRRVALVHPSTLESRIGLLCRTAGLSRDAGVRLMRQHPSLWLQDSRRLGPCAEELALLLGCCGATAVKILGTCPALLALPLPELGARVHGLARVMGAVLGSSRARAGGGNTDEDMLPPAAVVTLLLVRPGLLLAGGLDCSPRQQLEQRQQQIEERQLVQQQQLEELLQRADPGQLLLAAAMQQLSAGLALPMARITHMLAAAPELLPSDASALPSLASDTAAALDTLRLSWLCAGSGAAARQRYQARVMRILRRCATAVRQPHALLQQTESGSGSQGFVLRAAADGALLQSQWWARGTLGKGSDVQPAPVELSAAQRLALQSPALLVRATELGKDSPPDALLGRLAAALVKGVTNVSTSERQQKQQQLDDDELDALECSRIPHTVLLRLAQLEPGLLALPPTLLTRQAAGMAHVLRVQTLEQLISLLDACPALLLLTREQLRRRRAALQSALGLALPDQRSVLLLMLPQSVLRSAAFRREVSALSDDGGRGTLALGMLLPSSGHKLHRVV